MRTRTSKGLGNAAISIWNGVQVALYVAIMVPLMPVLLPLAGWSVTRTDRRLARTACISCGQPIGAEEINRAREEALRAAWAGYDPASGVRRRIAPVWNIVCRTCGHRYQYRSGEPRATLVSVQAGTGGRD